MDLITTMLHVMHPKQKVSSATFELNACAERCVDAEERTNAEETSMCTNKL